MKIVLSWLRRFAPIEGEVDDLAEQLTDLGMELESVERIGEGLDGIVLAKVLEIRPHPDADRIRLVDVDTGDGEALQICCGASNMEVGDLVPLATLGTTMPDGMEIARRKMRGEWSNGMLCSTSELQLGEDHSGILIVDPETRRPLGSPIADVLGVTSDVVFDFDALPNRPDTLSVLGVARDLAAHQGVPFTVPGPTLETSSDDASELASVSIDAVDLCGRFTARVARGVKVGESPRWMAQRLLAAGMRPVNNVVDVSNYVMLELGQPTHTYDLGELPQGRVGVRWARDGERIVTLDDVERTLTTTDGVVVDGGDRAIGIAGVMGGASTEISGSTTDVLIEAAWWQPQVISTSAERLMLHSEASLRFKRGVDPEIGRLAVDRVAELLVEVAGATICDGVLEARGDLPRPVTVDVSPKRINALLGTDIPTEEMTRMLEPIGFTTETHGDSLRVRVPSWRPDSAIEADVAEEVARHYGMANITKTVPVSPHTGGLTADQRDRRSLRNVLMGLGVSEAMPMPFLAPGDLESFGLPGSGFAIANPLVAEESVLRTTLLPGLVGAVAYNESHRRTGVRFFEIGRVFVPGGRPLVDVTESALRHKVLPGETERLGVVLAGAEAPEAVRMVEALLRRIDRWVVTEESLGLLDRACVPTVSLVAEPLPGLHRGRSASVRLGDRLVGSVGEIDPGTLERHGISQRVAWLELDLDAVLEIDRQAPVEVAVSSYPTSDIDLAFVVDSAVDAASVRRTLVDSAMPTSEGAPVPVEVGLFDVFRSDSIGATNKSLAFHIRFQAMDRTLTDAEVAEVRGAMITAVESTHGATLRG